ncbi:hypothetical protein HKX48_004090 [Thoreauomyces humboldtii]|nr:hypothetical protein HKX48_004090 [Thoreauomyces humboldtii]
MSDLRRPAMPSRRPTATLKVHNESNYYHSIKNLARFSGSVIPSIFIPTLLMTAWSALWTALYKTQKHTWLTNLFPSSVLLITIVSVVMGLLLVFRNNTAYDRYWEGRRLLGTLEMQVRNLARFFWIGVITRDSHQVMEKRGAMNLLIAFMHSTKHYLRNELGADYDDVFPYVSHLPDFAPDVSPPQVKNMPMEIGFHLGGFIQKARKNEQIDASQIGCITASLSACIDCFTGFERIRDTPLPLAYSVHLKQTLIVYLLSLPFQLCATNGWGTIPIQLVASFTLMGLEAIGGEIENPFGYDENDLPMDVICAMIHEEITGMMDRPDKLDCTKWLDPWEDLTSTNAKLNESAMFQARISVDHVK